LLIRGQCAGINQMGPQSPLLLQKQSHDAHGDFTSSFLSVQLRPILHLPKCMVFVAGHFHLQLSGPCSGYLLGLVTEFNHLNDIWAVTVSTK
jgi:hypothetical protein